MSTKPRTSRVGFVAIDAEGKAGKASIWEASLDRRFAPRHLAPANAEGSPVFDNAGDLFFAAGAGQGQLRLSHQRGWNRTAEGDSRSHCLFRRSFPGRKVGGGSCRSPRRRSVGRGHGLSGEGRSSAAALRSLPGALGARREGPVRFVSDLGCERGRTSGKRKTAQDFRDSFDPQSGVRRSGRSRLQVRGAISGYTRGEGDRSAICLAWPRAFRLRLS